MDSQRVCGKLLRVRVRADGPGALLRLPRSVPEKNPKKKNVPAVAAGRRQGASRGAVG